jgi:hypothetical protein
MKITLSLASFLVVSAAIVSVINCGKSDPTQGEPARLARKGEACQTTNDCGQGLACLPQGNSPGGVCVIGVFSVTPTAKECAIIECQTATDCCATPSSSCLSLKASCDSQRDAGFSNPSVCDTYNAECVCDAQQHDCENGQCVVKCVNDSTCVISGAGGKCLGGVCGQCSSDDDCKKNGGDDLLCVSGKCQTKCQGDGDCPGFDRCVGGKCTQGGCQNARECIAAYRNVEATCGTDGKCIVPCQSDLECSNPKGYNFYSCLNGQCTYMGCESDKDCRLLLTGVADTTTTPVDGTSGGTSSGSSGDVFLGSKEHVVCRDKTTPNPTTRPAQ